MNGAAGKVSWKINPGAGRRVGDCYHGRAVIFYAYV